MNEKPNERNDMMKYHATCAVTGATAIITAPSRDAAATQIFDTLARSYLNRRAGAWRRFAVQ